MPSKIIRYSQEELRRLEKSPLVRKPLWLPSLDELMEKDEAEASLNTLEGIVRRLEEERSFARSLKSFQAKMDEDTKYIGKALVTFRITLDEVSDDCAGALQKFQQIGQHIVAIIEEHTKVLKASDSAADETSTTCEMTNITMMITQVRMDQQFAWDEYSAYSKFARQYYHDAESFNKRWNDTVEYSFEFDREANEYHEDFKSFCKEVGERMIAMADESKSLMEAPHRLSQVIKALTKRSIRLQKGIKIMSAYLEGFHDVMSVLTEEAQNLARAQKHYQRLEDIFQRVKERALKQDIAGMVDAIKKKSKDQAAAIESLMESNTGGRWSVLSEPVG